MPNKAQVTALSKSASANTTNGPLPPSSSLTFLRLLEATAFKIPCPVTMLPRKRDFPYFHVLGQCSSSDWSLTTKNVDAARWETSLAHLGRQFLSHKGSKLGRFDDDGVPCGESGAELPARNHTIHNGIVSHPAGKLAVVSFDTYKRKTYRGEFHGRIALHTPSGSRRVYAIPPGVFK